MGHAETATARGCLARTCVTPTWSPAGVQGNTGSRVWRWSVGARGRCTMKRAHGQVAADHLVNLKRLPAPASPEGLSRAHFPDPTLRGQSWLVLGGLRNSRQKKRCRECYRFYNSTSGDAAEGNGGVGDG